MSEVVIYDPLSIRRDRRRFRGHRVRSEVGGHLGGQARAGKCAERSSKLSCGALLMRSWPWGACASRGSVIDVAPRMVARRGWDLPDPEGLQDGGGDTYRDNH